MTGNTLSPADAALRQRITELSVHIPCGRLRGPVSGRWQSCLCEDAPEKWESCDVSREQDLCVICLRATAGGTSRWAWLACADCRKANDAIVRMQDEYGDRPFALTRYSLTNGNGVPAGASPEGAQQRFSWFQAFAEGDLRVYQWCEHEYPRLAGNFDAQADVPLRTWQQQWPPSLEASIDAYGRLLGRSSDSPTADPTGAAVGKRPTAQDDQPPSDLTLRERLTELSVHIRCGRVRGPISGRWQSCPCEDAPEKWPGCDVSHERDLCIVCVRGTAGGTSRWAWLGCETCSAVNSVIGAKTGKGIPLGRHSIMNGYAVRGGAPPELQREQAARLAQFVKDRQDLRKWEADEFRRVAARFSSDADIPLTVWQRELPPSREVSIDAMIRLTWDEGFLREVFT